jgi:hypothetical protein
MVGDHELEAVLERLIIEHHDSAEERIVDVFQECLEGVGASPATAQPELVYRLASLRLAVPTRA